MVGRFQAVKARRGGAGEMSGPTEGGAATKTLRRPKGFEIAGRHLVVAFPPPGGSKPWQISSETAALISRARRQQRPIFPQPTKISTMWEWQKWPRGAGFSHFRRCERTGIPPCARVARVRVGTAQTQTRGGFQADEEGT